MKNRVAHWIWWIGWPVLFVWFAGWLGAFFFAIYGVAVAVKLAMALLG